MIPSVTSGHPGAWRGIFAIPVTTFTPDGALDPDGLRRQVRFCLQAGATGIVYPGVVSEFFTLDDDERRLATATVVRAVDGAVPVVVGVSATAAPDAARLAGEAEQLGAAGVMATLPYVQHLFTPDQRFVHEYFGAIGAASSLPLALQNARIGHPIPIAGLAAVLDAVPAVRYLKEETAPSTHRLTQAIDAVGDRLDGVFAGLGGVFLMSELERGAAGSMPSPPLVDVLCRAYAWHTAGDRVAARAELSPLAGLLSYEVLYNLAVIKELLVRRGVISSAACRTPVPRLDAVDHRELDDLLAPLELPTFTP